MNIADQLNDNLKAFDYGDPLYMAVISDRDGVEEPVIVNFQDLNIGALAGMLEWNRRLTVSLVKQMDLQQAQGKWLDLIAHKHIGLQRYEGETDAVYVGRIVEFIVAHKTSKAAIIAFMRRYSPTGEPELLEGAFDSAFADASFADVYQGFWLTDNSAYIFPALATASDSQAFFFILILKGTDPADIPAVVDTMRRFVAAGVEYEIHITA